MSRKFSKPCEGDLHQERLAQLSQILFNNLGIVTEAEQSKFWGRFGKIGSDFEYRLHAAIKVYGDAAAVSDLSLSGAKQKLDTSAKRHRKSLEIIDTEEPYERTYGTATDNPFACSQLHEAGRQKHKERLERRRKLVALLAEEEADSQERLNAKGWQTRGGHANTHSMAHGDPFSRIFTDCCPLFEEFQAGSISYTPGGKFFNVAACIFELITGHDPNNNDLGLSLENQIRTAVELYKKHTDRS